MDRHCDCQSKLDALAWCFNKPAKHRLLLPWLSGLRESWKQFWPCICHAFRCHLHKALSLLPTNGTILCSVRLLRQLDIIHEDNVELRLMVINSEVARVRFTNSENERIDFPANVEIRKLHHGQQAAQPEAVDDNEVILTRYNSYVVLRDGQTLFRLENQTQQAIEGSPDLVVVVP